MRSVSAKALFTEQVGENPGVNDGERLPEGRVMPAVMLVMLESMGE